MIVDVDELEKCLRYLKSINSSELSKIVWMKNGNELFVSQSELDEFLELGLSNRDLPSILGWMPDDIGIKISTMSIFTNSEK